MAGGGLACPCRAWVCLNRRLPLGNAYPPGEPSLLSLPYLVTFSLLLLPPNFFPDGLTPIFTSWFLSWTPTRVGAACRSERPVGLVVAARRSGLGRARGPSPPACRCSVSSAGWLCLCEGACCQSGQPLPRRTAARLPPLGSSRALLPPPHPYPSHCLPCSSLPSPSPLQSPAPTGRPCWTARAAARRLWAATAPCPSLWVSRSRSAPALSPASQLLAMATARATSLCCFLFSASLLAACLPPASPPQGHSALSAPLLAPLPRLPPSLIAPPHHPLPRRPVHASGPGPRLV